MVHIKDLTICRNIGKGMVYCEQGICRISTMPLEEYKNEKLYVVIIITTPFNSMGII